MVDTAIGPTVAAVLAGADRVCGTAFFIGPDLALTCDHVLNAARGEQLSLRPVGADGAEPVIDRIRDDEHDLALLRVEARPGRPVLRLDPELAPRGPIGSHGFPWDQLRIYPHGLPMAPASCSGLTIARWKSRQVTALVINASLGQGMSGAPAVDLDTGAVVGVLRFSQHAEKRSLAVPARTVVQHWPALRVAADAAAPTFDQVSSALPEEMASTKWTDLVPGALHCVVIGSETLSERPGPQRLDTLAAQTLLHWERGPQIWKAVADARQGRTSVGGLRRDFADGFRGTNVRCARFDVLDAFANPDSFDLAVRLIVEADLALVDVTRFEPGVMLLLGIRAATRRGVTVASHGGGWKEGDWQRPAGGGSPELVRLYRPFNLSDISLSSHTPGEPAPGDDPRIARLARRVRTGFEQLARQPYYRDLPVYDALRQLGGDATAWSSIGLDSEVLVLCPYAADFYPTWSATLWPRLSEALSRQDIRSNVYRLQDLATPQVISQSLYERIRRCAACVADWTDASPSTFFELGVRMTVSRWDVVQIARADWLDRQLAGGQGALRQVALMNDLLRPLAYQEGEASDIGERIAKRLRQLIGRSGGSSGHRVRRTAAAAIGMVEDRLPELPDQLSREADALSLADEQQNIPQTLFYEVTDIKRDHERAATERRLAAWLYLEHRVRAAEQPESDPRRAQWRTLGAQVAADLYRTGAEEDGELADHIAHRIGVDSVDLLRNAGDMQRQAGREDAARSAYQRAVAVADDKLAALGRIHGPDPESAVARAKAELLGSRGGLLHRLGERELALDSYRQGAEVEAAARLPSTYNRTNEIKQAIRAGADTLSGLTTKLTALREVLERRVATDERATDDAWLWADLGDVRLLLDDEAAAAEAYRAFAKKAKSTSPASTLKAIREVAAALADNGDPAAGRVAAVLGDIELELRG